MALGKQVAVGVAATKLDDEAGSLAGHEVTITNQDAAISVFLGDSTVTNSGGTAGYELKAGKTITLHLTNADEVVYAIAASGTPRVDVIATTLGFPG